MMKLLMFIVYVLLFFLILRFVRMLMRYWSNTKSTMNKYKESQRVKSKFDDVEEAEFREIPNDNSKESEEKKD